MTQPEGSSGGSFFTRRVGALPMWAWIGLAVGALLAVIGLRSKSSSTTGQQDQGATTGNLDPTYVFQSYNQPGPTYITVPQAPPAGGRGPGPQGPPVNTPVPVPTQPIPPPPPVRTGDPGPNPPPAGSWITAVGWKPGQPAGTPSTLWGMAEQAYSNGHDWTRIWNAPQNAAIVAKRGDPKKIQAGDRFWIPK